MHLGFNRKDGYKNESNKYCPESLLLGSFAFSNLQTTDFPLHIAASNENKAGVCQLLDKA
jgi:hypothetical protein